jgi:class 3 adenylate cyclase
VVELAQTFLFMDLVGFTALTAERGDDGAADVALRFYDHVRQLLVEHQAEEIKTIGDAMMVRCEDPQLAVQLGLEIVDNLDAVPGFPPLRVGVHTGSAVARSGDWYGSAVNVAARLCAAAGGGEVLVSDATRQAAAVLDRVDIGERQLHWLKNVSQPVTAWPVAKCADPTPRRRLRGLIERARHRPAAVCLPRSEVAT